MTFAWRTEPQPPARNGERLALAAILALAMGLRVRHIDFGLPSLNDPDEPVFIMTALDMLREGRLNPGWFGHPGTVLFYLLAVVIAAVAIAGLAVGHWTGADGFVAAVFTDPAIIVLPMRLAMAVLGVASVWMAWRIGRCLAGSPTGLIGALMLAVNPLHVELSQVIRTDMLATVLMSWSMLHALGIARHGRAREHVRAGIAAGLAGATKWPALLVLVGPVVAGLRGARADRRSALFACTAPAVAALTLLLASPYLVLDWRTVLHDLGGEARPGHLGATGHGLVGNLIWYVRHPLLDGFGALGLILLGAGTIAAARLRGGGLVLLPTSAVIAVALSAQSLVWARWIVPLLPVAAVLIALGLVRTAALIRAERLRRLATSAGLACLVAGMAATSLEQQTMRGHDPRQAATAWALRHVAPGRSILIEHAGFDLLRHRGTLLFPLGSAGCVDVRATLARGPTHRSVNTLRDRRAIVDIGHLDRGAIAACRADVLILSNHARYRSEAAAHPNELANYRALLAGYERVALWRGPAAGPADREVEVYVRSPDFAEPLGVLPIPTARR